ncbi:uncharacterized protein H6S33_004183 [Morchella sextelata]|uniref:uncharacterized protein n=1 Tax=Morchella sextelata TaxID=1174677 RepID=UPI001D05814E|nr:uncharacterized protein H6S33_004183 [Morchella sextelata]KAH0605726.1 hypothetical protein H6S33_004183 [Morchella sextelata]
MPRTPAMCHHITTRYTCGHSFLPSPDDPPCTRSYAEHQKVLSYFKAKKTGEICPGCRTGRRLIREEAQEMVDWEYAQRAKNAGAEGGGGGGKVPQGAF